MAHPIAFELETYSGTEQGTAPYPVGSSTVFSRLPHYDILTFLAIVQKMPCLHLFHFVPRVPKIIRRKGLSGTVYSASLPFEQDLIFKKFIVTQTFTEELAYKALICEILVLEHPILKKQPNIMGLLGVAWDVQTFQGRLIRAMPVLVMKKSEHGTLESYMNSKVSFAQRVQFCRDVGKAIEAMHELNIVHGDIKPHNILICEDGIGLVAKVIDFGCTCFGSRDEDMVLLSRSVQWAAPEVGNMHMSMKAAKLADIYSYGMVCAWTFFGQETPIADFTHLPSDLDEAIERLLQIRDTESEQFQEISLMLSASTKRLREFFECSFQAMPERRTRNIKYLIDHLEYLKEMWNIRQEISVGNDDFRLNLLSALAAALRLARIKHQISIFIGHLFVFLTLGRNNKAFIPGRPQLVFDDSEIWPTLIFIEICTAFMLSILPLIALAVGAPHKAISALLAIPLVLVCIVTGCFLFFNESWSLFWYRIRLTWRSITIYGQTQHSIPNLPDMYAYLNEIHYLVREQIVMELERRSKRGCSKCLTDAGLQLALCYYTALGTPRNAEASMRWLQLAKKKESDLHRLCREVEYSLNRDHIRLLFIADQLFTFSVRFIGVSEVNLYYDRELPNITKRLLQEIDGKRTSKVGLKTVSLLQEKLGYIYREHKDLKAAEYYLRAAKGSMRFNKAPQYSLTFASLLEEQGKESEALHELQIDSKLMINPNGRFFLDTDSKLHPAAFENRRFYEREMLANLLIRQEDSGTALKMDLLSDFSDIRDSRDRNDDIKIRILDNILALAQLLFKQMRKDLAVGLLQKRVQVHDETFGTSHPRTMKATSDLVFMLSSMGTEHIDTALRIQPPVLDQHIYPYPDPHIEGLLLKIALAFALSKKGRFDEAIVEIDLVSQHKKQNWTCGENVTETCMRDLAGSLYVQGKEESLVPLIVQDELLGMTRRTQSPEVKAQIIDILCTLPRQGKLKEVLRMLELLKENLETTCPDQRKDRILVGGFIVFILANVGLCYESPAQTEEALNLSITLREEVLAESDSDDLDRLYVTRSLASVYWIKSFVTCNYHGFGIYDLSWMNEAEHVHHEAMTMARALFGSAHKITAYATEKMASLLARQGAARADSRLLRRLSLQDDGLIYDLLKYYSTLDLCDTFEENYYNRFYIIWDQTYNHDHPGYLAKRERTARVFSQSRDLDSRLSGRKMLSEALEILREYYLHTSKKPDYHPQVIRALEALAQADWVQGNTFQTLAMSKYIMHLADKTFPGGDSHPSTIGYRLLLLKNLLLDDVKFPNKVETASELLKLCEEKFGKQHTRTISCMNELASILCEQSRFSEATQLMREALELGLPFLGNNHSIVSQSWINLLLAINSTTRGDSNISILITRDMIVTNGESLNHEVHDLTFNHLRIPWSSVVTVREEITRMVLGAKFLGAEHIFTKMVMESLVLLFWCGCGMTFEMAIQALQKIKDMPWSGFKPSETSTENESLHQATFDKMKVYFDISKDLLLPLQA